MLNPFGYSQLIGPSPRFFAITRREIMKNFVRFVKQEDGATAIEYGLIASLIAVVIITALTSLGTGLVSTFDSVAAKL